MGLTHGSPVVCRVSLLDVKPRNAGAPVLSGEARDPRSGQTRPSHGLRFSLLRKIALGPGSLTHALAACTRRAPSSRGTCRAASWRHAGVSVASGCAPTLSVLGIEQRGERAGEAARNSRVSRADPSPLLGDRISVAGRPSRRCWASQSPSLGGRVAVRGDERAAPVATAAARGARRAALARYASGRTQGARSQRDALSGAPAAAARAAPRPAAARWSARSSQRRRARAGLASRR